MTHAVILAAGTGSRFGGQKLLALLDGKPLIAHVVAAVAHLPTVVVGPPELEPHIYPARLVENLNPERGMAHSLRLANAAIDTNDALLVLLADMPWITRAIADLVIASAGDADICYRIRNNSGGHPVRFSPHEPRSPSPRRRLLCSLRDDHPQPNHHPLEMTPFIATSTRQQTYQRGHPLILGAAP